MSMWDRIRGIEDKRFEELEFRLSVLEKKPVSTELEEQIVQLENHFNQQISELRERLEMPQRKRPSGRPFHLLKNIAELGEMAQRTK